MKPFANKRKKKLINNKINLNMKLILKINEQRNLINNQKTNQHKVNQPNKIFL